MAANADPVLLAARVTLAEAERGGGPLTVDSANPHVTTSATAPHAGPKKLLGGLLDIGGLQHFLRVRKRLVISDKCTAELGLDYDVKNQTKEFGGALFYDVHRKGEKFATLRINKNSICAKKSVQIDTKPIGFTLHGLVGMNFQGMPEVGVDVDKIRPVGLIVVAAITLLGLGRTLAGNRGIGNIRLQPPFLYDDVNCKAEFKGSIKREGKSLGLRLNQLNGVIYL